jgi:hypothetical protein
VNTVVCNNIIIIKLCKSTGLRILNGRHRSGFANDYTYCRATSLSVIDYLISIIDLFNYVDKFTIHSHIMRGG